MSWKRHKIQATRRSIFIVEEFEQALDDFDFEHSVFRHMDEALFQGEDLTEVTG